MLTISLNEIEQTTQQALTVHGASSQVATQVAHAVRVAEGNGNRICGLYYVESYCQQLRTGRVDGTVAPTVSHDRPGAVRVDGHFGFAQAAFAAGLPTAIKAAKQNGICGFSLEHTHTCTSLGYFTEQLAQQGFLAIGATNASARVAPPGGSEPVLGTNPIAMAVPDGRGGVAFQFDFSTSAVALGKITMAAAAGETIPLGWAVDAQGEPTTDPQEALMGSLVSAGGYKGYGIGLMVEVLASALTGSRLSAEVPPLKTPEGAPHNLGQFYIVIDPSGFHEDFAEQLSTLAKSIANQDGARLPGTNRKVPDVVSVEDAVWSTVQSLASAKT
ncbi:MAG: Ldh family oxidoreductase [Actinobacteria bacterium]|jgi:(2R)-3-sulfolactate dehydrogenase (NADP+)|nr:Ldh family oxidoreductase [Actinomycetota bacterium]MBT3746910.1 Ldh family oxidoreductase [Actinomycetota bacterium]MBT3969861.1 Ldh family oxidoreductase [Actinomycetota bacterium]MBT4009104.1 Ldh family oxidoreductase [Actinomycetota bacterium]MBT4302243.1 Ldh family oxidoreductase [Actinomycetota bacterium]